MKKMRIFLAVVLCVSLLAFAGCGSDTDSSGAGDETVTEETTDAADESDSLGEDMKDDAEDAVDDMEDAVDGSDTDSTTETDKN